MVSIRERNNFSSMMWCFCVSSSTFLRHFSFVLGLIVLSASIAGGFNFDIPSAVHQFNADALGGNFGASIAAYEDQGRPWVLVGAPTAVNRLRDRAGEGFRCNSFKNVCRKLPIRPYRTSQYRTVDQGLGTTVAAVNKSWNSDGITLICAPRIQLNRRAANATTTSIDATGECYAYLGGASRYTTINPCKRQLDMGSCLAGLSASLGTDPVKKQIHIALGMPGAFVSEGNVFLGTYRENGEEVNQVMLKMRPGDWANKGFGLGYSVLLANLLPLEKTENDLITASPMWVENGYRGVVVITDKNMQSDEALVIRDTMGHVGSFFGHSLAALDLNGDSILDLVVGAPYFSASERTDVGRVYILYGESRKGSYAIRGDPVVLEGPNPDGRFGHVVTSLGDIDGDGLADLGVGCPYCGKDGRGAVFIYLSRRGELIGGFADQVIEASSVIGNYRSNFTDNLDFLLNARLMPKAPPLNTFGWSISGGADFDQNAVPDLAIGARRADTVTYMRGKPTGRLVLLANQTKIPKSVALDSISCGKISVCRFYVTFTIRLMTWPPSEEREFPFELKFDFDSLLPRSDEKRIRLVDDPAEYLHGADIPTVNLARNYSISRQPQMISFTLEPLISRVERNRWQPIRISLRIRPLWSQNYSGANDLKFRALPLVLYRNSLANYTFPDIFITNRDCVSEVCKSDIFVKLTEKVSNNTEKGVVFYGATKETREMRILVGNRGEPAYNSRLRFRFPAGVHYMTEASPLRCVEVEETNSSLSEREILEYGERTTVECRLPTPLRRTTPIVRLRFVVKPSMAILTDYIRRRLLLRFTAEAVSQNPDVHRSNNIAEIRYKLRARSRVQLDPSSDSGDGVLIDSRNVTVRIQSNQHLYADTIGPELRHVYRLTNFGPSPASRVDVNISVPLYTSRMQQLLYVLPKVKKVIHSQKNKPEFETVTTLPRVISTDGKERGQCFFDERYLDPYKLRVLQTSKSTLIHRYRRSANQAVNYETKLKDDASSSEVSAQRGSFLTGWKSRQVEEVRCDQKDSQFGDIFCAIVRCTVYNLTRNEVVRIVFEARLWADTYFREKTSDVAISTEASGRLAPSLDGIPVSGPLNLSPLRMQQTFIFRGIQSLVTKQIPWWPILVATFLGLLLLGLIILVMWKCGFFKRHRPSDKEFAM